MFLAALQDIPRQLYEAASIDGASKWRQFWSITLPLLRPVILLVVVLGTIGTFQVFDQAYIMTSGGPLDTTLTPVLLIYQKVLGSQRTARAGYSSAMAFVLSAIIFVFAFVQRRFIERGTEQY
jgi:multiple sugar transport system permease protein